jgi:hypothetical protein
MAQRQVGAVEQKVTDSICACMAKKDLSTVKTKQEATNVFLGCFSKQASLLVPLAQERKVEITDKVAMRELGQDIGKNLLNQNCQSFMTVSMIMAKDEIDKEEENKNGKTEGILKRIDTKDFNYIVVTDASGKEKSFIWLRQFEGSDKFAENGKLSIGKKVSIEWVEFEAYMPSVKSYFPLKEVVKLKVQ